MDILSYLLFAADVEPGLPFTNNHNVRSAELNFHIPQAGVLHGFAGYFEATLYGDVGLSIRPDTKDEVTPNMLSWFPLYIPVKVCIVAIRFQPF
jgi:protein arginine N-methyltransferase 5